MLFPVLLALASAATPPTVVVLDLKAHEGVSADLAETLGELLVVAVRDADPDARVMGSSDVAALLGFERQRALLGCQESSCLAELGGALGAKEIVSGSVAALGDRWLLVLRRLEVAHARPLAEISESLAKADAGKLPDAVRAAAGRLFGGPVPAPAIEAPVAEAHAAPRRGKAWPWVLSATAVACAGAAVFGVVEYEAYGSLRAQSQQQPGSVTVSQARSAQQLAQLGEGLGIGGTIAAAGLLAGTVLTW